MINPWLIVLGGLALVGLAFSVALWLDRPRLRRIMRREERSKKRK